MKKSRIIGSGVVVGALASLGVSLEAEAFVIPNGGSMGGTACQTANFAGNAVHGFYGNKGIVKPDGVTSSYFACPIIRTNHFATTGLTSLVVKINNPNALPQTCCVQSVTQDGLLLKSVCFGDTSVGPVTLNWGSTI